MEVGTPSKADPPVKKKDAYDFESDDSEPEIILKRVSLSSKKSTLKPLRCQTPPAATRATTPRSNSRPGTPKQGSRPTTPRGKALADKLELESSKVVNDKCPNSKNDKEKKPVKPRAKKIKDADQTEKPSKQNNIAPKSRQKKPPKGSASKKDVEELEKNGLNENPDEKLLNFAKSNGEIEDDKPVDKIPQSNNKKRVYKKKQAIKDTNTVEGAELQQENGTETSTKCEQQGVNENEVGSLEGVEKDDQNKTTQSLDLNKASRNDQNVDTGKTEKNAKGKTRSPKAAKSELNLKENNMKKKSSNKSNVTPLSPKKSDATSLESDSQKKESPKNDSPPDKSDSLVNTDGEKSAESSSPKTKAIKPKVVHYCKNCNYSAMSKAAVTRHGKTCSSQSNTSNSSREDSDRNLDDNNKETVDTDSKRQVDKLTGSTDGEDGTIDKCDDNEDKDGTLKNKTDDAEPAKSPEGANVLTANRCTHCNFSSENEDELSKHLEKCQSDKHISYHCTMCNYKAKKRLLLLRHQQSHGVFACSQCEYLGSDKDTLDEHSKQEHSQRIGMKFCKLCNRYIKNKVNFEEHTSKCQGRQPLICPECSREFKFESHLKMHLLTHVPAEEKKFICEICNYRTNYKANLAKHKLTKHDENRTKDVKCPDCDMMFFNDIMLSKHQKTQHNSDRPFRCEDCEKTYKTMHALRCHMVVHNPAKPFKCEVEGCDKTFKVMKALKAHQAEVHQQAAKKFACSFEGCTHVFPKMSHLRRHETAHTGERKFKCTWPGCDKSFRYPDNLKVHTRRHTDEKPIKCDLCDFTCRQKSSLQWHQKKYHHQGGAKTTSPAEKGKNKKQKKASPKTPVKNSQDTKSEVSKDLAKTEESKEESEKIEVKLEEENVSAKEKSPSKEGSNTKGKGKGKEKDSAKEKTSKPKRSRKKKSDAKSSKESEKSSKHESSEVKEKEISKASTSSSKKNKRKRKSENVEIDNERAKESPKKKRKTKKKSKDDLVVNNTTSEKSSKTTSKKKKTTAASKKTKKAGKSKSSKKAKAIKKEEKSDEVKEDENKDDVTAAETEPVKEEEKTEDVVMETEQELPNELPPEGEVETMETTTIPEQPAEVPEENPEEDPDETKETETLTKIDETDAIQEEEREDEKEAETETQNEAEIEVANDNQHNSDEMMSSDDDMDNGMSAIDPYESPVGAPRPPQRPDSPESSEPSPFFSTGSLDDSDMKGMDQMMPHEPSSGVMPGQGEADNQMNDGIERGNELTDQNPYCAPEIATSGASNMNHGMYSETGAVSNDMDALVGGGNTVPVITSSSPLQHPHMNNSANNPTSISSSPMASPQQPCPPRAVNEMLHPMASPAAYPIPSPRDISAKITSPGYCVASPMDHSIPPSSSAITSSSMKSPSGYPLPSPRHDITYNMDHQVNSPRTQPHDQAMSTTQPPPGLYHTPSPVGVVKRDSGPSAMMSPASSQQPQSPYTSMSHMPTMTAQGLYPVPSPQNVYRAPPSPVKDVMDNSQSQPSSQQQQQHKDMMSSSANNSKRDSGITSGPSMINTPSPVRQAYAGISPSPIRTSQADSNSLGSELNLPEADLIGRYMQSYVDAPPPPSSTEPPRYDPPPHDPMQSYLLNKDQFRVPGIAPGIAPGTLPGRYPMECDPRYSTDRNACIVGSGAFSYPRQNSSALEVAERTKQWVGSPYMTSKPPAIDSMSAPLFTNPVNSNVSKDSYGGKDQYISKDSLMAEAAAASMRDYMVRSTPSFPTTQAELSSDSYARYDPSRAWAAARHYSPHKQGVMTGLDPAHAQTMPNSVKHFTDAYHHHHQMASQLPPPHTTDYHRSLATPSGTPAEMFGRVNPTLNAAPIHNLGYDKFFYPRDPTAALYRTPNTFLPVNSATPAPPTLPSSRDYRGPIYPGQHTINPYNPFMGTDKQYMNAAAAGKLGQPLSGLTAHPGERNQFYPGAGAPPTHADPQGQDPYRRSVIYNMMNRYFE